MERTFVMVKPNGVERTLVGEIIKRIERKGLEINALKILLVSKEQAEKHYDVHQNKPFFQELVQYICSGPVVAMVVSGNNSVEIMRLLAGATDPTKSQPGTIRGDFSSDIRLNLIHTADTVERAKYEISIYFNENEIIDYKRAIDKHTFTKE